MLRGRPAEDVAHWLRRADLQLEFASAFAALQDEPTRRSWLDLIGEAKSQFNSFDVGEGVTGLAETVRKAESILKPIGDKAKSYTIQCVGHGHIDMNWMWSWPETVSTTHDTFASVLSLMDQYSQFTYSQSQASVYALTEKYYPLQFAEIQQRVKEGRWEVTAAHWVEGDKNLASGESIVRQMLYARDYFKSRFGLEPEDVPVDWEPDTFGHALTIPMIVSQGAAKYYYSCRMGGGFDHEIIGSPRPRLFYWRAPDGARILVNRESTWYNSYVNIGDNIALPMVNFVKETGLHQWLNIYGVGNHGGGPTRKELEYLISLSEWPIYPNVRFGTAAGYFRDVESEIAGSGVELPVLDHELNFEFTGCYTSQSAIKRGNRWGENYLEEAETLALLGERLAGETIPREQLREAWINVLFNQFHDILPGSGVRETREHAQALFQEVGAVTGAIKRSVTKLLAGRIDTISLLPDNYAGREERALAESGKANTPFVAGAGIGAMETGFSQSNGGGTRFLPFVVYNHCSWPRTERVQAALYDTSFEAGQVVALNDEGQSQPTMLLGKGGDWGHDKLTVAFDAVDVPALGYRTYLLCEGDVDRLAPAVHLHADEWLETPYFRFRLDRFQSGLAELIDKRTGMQLVRPESSPFGAWQYVTERPRGMTAWALGEELDDPVNLRSAGFGFHGAARNQGTAAPVGGPTMGYRAEWRLDVPGTQSKVTLSMMIHGLEPRLDFKAEIDWREIGDDKRGIPGLVVSFPGICAETATFEAPFGSVERKSSGNEVPTLRYAHVSSSSGTSYSGITLVQDCKYGHEVRDGWDLRMRIVRSSFDPDHAPEVTKSTVRYAVYIHDMPQQPAYLARLGAGWNHPMIVAPTNIQHGDAPASGGFATVLSENVVLTALKSAEDGAGIVIRLNELNGVDGEAVVEISPELANGLSTAKCADILERSVPGTVRWDGHRLRVPIKKYSLVTVRLTQ